MAAADHTTWFEDQSATEQQAIIDYAYDRSPVATVPYPDAEAEASDLEAAVADLDGSTATGAADVAKSDWLLELRAGLVPAPELAFPDITLAAGSFELGWQIGTGARKLFVKLFGPDGAGTGGAWDWQSLHWFPHGSWILYGATVQQSPGAYLYRGDYNGGLYDPVRWFESPCTFSGFAPPDGARLQTGVATTASCYVWPNTYPIKVDYPYLTREDLTPKQPLHPYDATSDGTPTITTPAPPDPGTDAVGGAIAPVLDGPDGAAVRAEMDWVEDGASDPIDDPARTPVPYQTPPTTDWRRWCERSTPGTGAAGLDAAADPFAVYTSYPAQAIGSADMRYGDDDVFQASWNDIVGFGIRKIAWKHGWGPEDEAATAAALAAPVLVTGPEGSRGRYRYYGPEYDPDPSVVAEGSLGTGRCRRIVVVDTVPKQGETLPRGIITSYGEWTGPEPPQ